MKTLACAFALSTLIASPVLAQCVPIETGLPGWERLDFDDLTPNSWAEDDGALVASSNASASMLYTAVAPTTAPILTWRWRVDDAVPATDLTRKGGDDRSLALTIGFAYDSANASMGERMKRVLVESVAGADAPGRIIDFVWGGNQPAGTRIESPYSGNAARIVVRRSATHPSGEWETERVNLADLYTELWGSAPSPVSRIALFIDTDDTGGTGQSRISDICFSHS